MGCCTSRSVDTGHSPPPYGTNQPHVNSTTPIAGQGQSPRASTGSRQSGHRRYLSPASRFNERLKPHVYVSKTIWTPSRLERERRDFFDTRVSGRAEVWACIKSASELFRQGESETAQLMVNALGMTVPTGDMVDGVYDSTGAYYQVPEWAVADPVNLQEDDDIVDKDISDTKAEGLVDDQTRTKNEKGKAKAPPVGEGVVLKARLSDRATDITLNAYKTDTIAEIVQRIKEETRISSKVKLAYLGRILPESQTVEASGWQTGHVLNALVFGAS